MNKYLMMSAAALMAGTAPAFAGDGLRTHSLHFLSAGGGSYCQGLQFRGSTNLYFGTLLQTACGSGNVPVIGGGSKTKGTGRIMFVENLLNPPNGAFFTISTPLQNGGAWSLYFTSNDVSSLLINSGTYKLGAPRAAGKPSIQANVAAAIAQWKAQKQ